MAELDDIIHQPLRLRIMAALNALPEVATSVVTGLPDEEFGQIVAAAVLVVAALVYFAIVQAQAPANAAYPAIDGVSCDSGEHGDFHIHAHVSIYIDGKPATVPAQIGIAPDSSCLYWLHTHSSDGVIHIEAPNGLSITLKNLLARKFRQPSPS